MKQLKQALSTVLFLLKAILKSIKPRAKPSDITTTKNNFDFRGVFSLQPLHLNKNDYRKEDFLIRILGVTVCFLMVVVVLLTITLFTLLPLQKIQPLFLSVASESKQVYFVEPLEKKTKAFRLVTESLIHQYIEARESIDLITEKERYGFVFYLSSPLVFNEFKEEYNEENKQSPINKAKKYKLSRGVQIEFISFLNDEQLQVDFTLYEYKKQTGDIVSKANMRATIKIAYKTNKIQAREKYMNPLGLRVLDYSLATKNKQDFIILKESD